MSARFYPRLILLLLPLTLLSPSVVFAQELFGTQIATNVEIDEEALPGDILVLTGERIVKATAPYDHTLFGVVVENSAVVLNQETSKTASVLSQGEAQIKVSAKNGSIQVGDFITSSNDPGVGQKA